MNLTHLCRSGFGHFTLAGVLLGLLFEAPSPAASFTREPAPVFVNELHYDNGGEDSNEAVEIAGPAETDLSGWHLVLYNGSTGDGVLHPGPVGPDLGPG